MRRALRDLEKEQGRHRDRSKVRCKTTAAVRVGPYRVIVAYRSPRAIECVFAERRGIVYEVFADVMIERLMRDE